MESASIAAHGHGHVDEHEHHGPPEAHQSARIDRTILGILLFILSEVMLFGAFFAAYFFLRVVADPASWPPEGFELPVLEGMASVFELGRTSLIIELDAPNEPELSQKSAAVIELLDRYGYQTNALPSAYPDTDWEVAHLHATPR